MYKWDFIIDFNSFFERLWINIIYFLLFINLFKYGVGFMDLCL